MTEFHFAWVEPTETTFIPSTHARMDENVLSAEVTHIEGEFPALKIEVKLPASGLLNPAQKLYAWFSVTRNATTTPILFGRLTGFPEDLTNVTATLELISQFPGWAANLAALFNSLKVSPFWDLSFIPASDIDDPRAALESRSALYHFDRITGAVVLSDIFDGTSAVELTPFLDPFSVQITRQPASRVNVTASVEWEQRITGESLRPGARVRLEFGGTMSSFTPEAIEEGWPEVGDTLGGSTGYYVTTSRIRRLNNVSSTKPTATDSFFAGVSVDEQRLALAATGMVTAQRSLQYPRTWFDIDLRVYYDYRQKRIETLTFAVNNDVQALQSSTDDPNTLSLDLHAEDVVSLGLQRSLDGSFFLSTNGQNAFKYLLAVAKANLAHSARAIEVTFELNFWDALTLSCDMTGTVVHPRLPGGTATGKIIKYQLIVAGDGTLNASVTLGVSVGNGNAYVPDAGDPDYCEITALGTDTQIITGEFSGGVGLTEMIYESFQDQIPTLLSGEAAALSGNIVADVSVDNAPDDQAATLIANQYPSRTNLDGVLAEIPTEINMSLVDLSGQDEIQHQIVVTIPHPFAAPKGINLEA